MNISFVDVRDVATAHIVAMTCPEAAGNRHIATSANLFLGATADIIAKEFKPYGYETASLGEPVLEAGMFKSDNTRMREVLGIKPIPIEDTFIEMAYNLIETGKVEKKPGYKGPPAQVSAL